MDQNNLFGKTFAFQEVEVFADDVASSPSRLSKTAMFSYACVLVVVALVLMFPEDAQRYIESFISGEFFPDRRNRQEMQADTVKWAAEGSSLPRQSYVVRPSSHLEAPREPQSKGMAAFPFPAAQSFVNADGARKPIEPKDIPEFLYAGAGPRQAGSVLAGKEPLAKAVPAFAFEGSGPGDSAGTPPAKEAQEASPPTFFSRMTNALMPGTGVLNAAEETDEGTSSVQGNVVKPVDMSDTKIQTTGSAPNRNRSFDIRGEPAIPPVAESERPMFGRSTMRKTHKKIDMGRGAEVIQPRPPVFRSGDFFG